MKKAALILGLSLTLLAAGCSSDYAKGNVTPVTTDTSDGANPYNVLVEDRMYYIPAEDNDPNFHLKYSSFIKANPDLEVFDVEVELSSGTYNGIEGYFIFTKPKEGK